MREKRESKASRLTATAGKFKIEFQPQLLNALIKPPSDFTEPVNFSVRFPWQRSPQGRELSARPKTMNSPCLSGPTQLGLLCGLSGLHPDLLIMCAGGQEPTTWNLQALPGDPSLPLSVRGH